MDPAHNLKETLKLSFGYIVIIVLIKLKKSLQKIIFLPMSDGKFSSVKV